MASEASIGTVQAWANDDLPEDYLELLNTRGGEFCNDRVRLYGIDEIIERNDTYETSRYCPGFITIGDDSGGRAIVIALGKGPGPVYLVDHGAMTPDCFDLVAPDIRSWLSGGCAFDVPRDSAPAYRLSVRCESKVSPRALNVLRGLSPPAKDMSIVELSNVFAGNQPFDLGFVAEHRRLETARQLADAGFIVMQEAVT